MRRQWLPVGVALTAGTAVLGVLYVPEIAAAGGVWIASTAFNHCFLVLPLAAYLLYAKWQPGAVGVPQPAPAIGAVALPIAICWFIVQRIGIMEARQLLAMSLLQVLFLAALGPRTWRFFAVPLLYLFFLVPTGEFLVPWLQTFTTHFVGLGLRLLSVPHFTDGVIIEIPEGRFLVAEACAGLRFLIASLAFGVFFACLIYTSPRRRLLFIVASLVIPVVANGIRALGTVYLGHLLGSPEAAAVDHVLYGWLFFAIVTFLLILAGLPFRQSMIWRRPAPPPVQAVSVGAAAAAVAIVAVLAAAPRLLADNLDRDAGTAAAAAPIVLPRAAGCAPVDLAADPARPGMDAAAQTLSFRCRGEAFLRLSVFPAQTGAGPVFAMLRGASILPGWDEVAAGAFAASDGAANWRLIEIGHQQRFMSIATALWIDGRVSSQAISGRIRQAVAGLRRDAPPTIVAIVSTQPADGLRRGRAAIEQFLRRLGGLPKVIAQLSRPPPSGAAPR